MGIVARCIINILIARYKNLLLALRSNEHESDAPGFICIDAFILVESGNISVSKVIGKEWPGNGEIVE
ncbi:hypothetical protein [Neptunomonas japonica]|uniref:hypothetical protein n=1 Tax=Neptunomonas japonica TaxID=417574 RepID=UPI00048DEB29